ncbi:cytochrome c oxidase accessory protein CcoG [Nitratiruptor tergarcus]|uniref:Cytochrome c oxidase accessory protein FixG n=1 Tax=Nitratiruptor tergarcus DSM 16512 TaxID=1069081 RepID=A0A1W1WRE9_9BACT|nr:cytochrome c oxidase accessory protein CcoG [Nitratiruptor tergarcus]SMC08826.1 cytochrome c oxidase accessory protein FixG [Nitratiruptor tergarcus DSM 16512]
MATATAKPNRAKEYLKNWVPYRYKRYIVFGLVTVISLVLPWIRINGNHFFLLNFDHKQLHLFFVRFDMQELYLMPFLLWILFFGIFFITTLGGRVWCGWSCPQTIFRVIYRDLIETKLLHLRKRISNKQIEPDMSKPENKVKKLIAILLWSVLAFIAAADFIWYFVPPEDFFQYIQDPANHTILMGFWIGTALFLIADVVFIKENFCIYICPYARVQSVLYDEDTFQTVYDYKRGGRIYDEHGNLIVHNKKELKAQKEEAECTLCESCVKVCPTHIDIRKGMQLECINCLECADACTKVMGALGKESLVRWTSYHALETGEKTRVFRFRIIAYIVMLTIAFVALFWMGSKKEHMLLNINRTSQLYKIEPDGRVKNTYVFLFQNTENKKHKYYFEIVNNKDIKIARPSKPFSVIPGKKVKKVVILYTDKVLVKNTQKDTPIPIKIKAYAVDDPKKIVVYRDTIFVFPRWDIYQKHIKK